MSVKGEFLFQLLSMKKHDQPNIKCVLSYYKLIPPNLRQPTEVLFTQLYIAKVHNYITIATD